MVTIKTVTPGSLADRAGILAGETLLALNGQPVRDVLDYRFYLTERRVCLRLEKDGEVREVTLKKPEYDDIGLEFETGLMDEQHCCRNQCIFCFIDQLPKGMRKTLYFKDDDSRLSFLTGSYVTLTNMSEEELDRIIRMRLSPINVSVHTTDPALRVQMMKNPRAALIMEQLKKLKDAGIAVNGQIVLCKNINDGEALERTMHDLASLAPELQSVSVVPFGMTDHREGLCRIEPFSPEDCRRVIGQVTAFAQGCRSTLGTRLFFCSDEFYLRAGLPLPEEREYEGYPQLDNGVGSVRSLRTEFEDALASFDPASVKEPRCFSVATGTLAAPLMRELVGLLHEKAPMLSGKVYAIENDYFGRSVTVAGLVTGTDLVRQLQGKDLGSRLYLPRVMLRHEGDRFLDDMTPEQVGEALGVPLSFAENDGFALLACLAGEEGEDTTWQNR